MTETKLHVKECDAYSVKVYMAGDVAVAKQVIRAYCMKGLCVNITPVDYIYTMGEESGYVVELINYARFPCSVEVVWESALELATEILNKTFQKSFTIMDNERSYWYSREGDVA